MANSTTNCHIAVNKDLLKNKQKGAADYRTSENILLVKWKDNKDVILASNFEIKRRRDMTELLSLT